MNCQSCGHNYPNTLTRCPRCKALSNRRGQRSGDSRLIEFPRKARPAPENEPTDTAMPQWRQDLNEKVRAIRARRNNPAMATAVATARSDEQVEAGTNPERRNQSRTISETAAAILQGRSTRMEAFAQTNLDPQPPTKSANPIVEKALSRVRRASENAQREYLPKIEPAKPTRPAYAVENEAT